MALGALALLVMSGVTAGAEPEATTAEEAVQAIDTIVGEVRADAVDVTDVDGDVLAGDTVVEFSADAADGISVAGPSGADLEIGLPFAQAADEGEIVDGSLVFDNNNGSTTTPLVQGDGSVQILTTIADASAPTQYAYSIGVGPGGVLVPTADGGIDIVDANGVAVSHIEPAWAYDAAGSPVATWYEVSGETLIQYVDHADVAHPVVADPKVTSGIISGTTYWNKAETKSLAQTTITGVVAACGLAGAAMAGAIGAAVLGAKCAVEAYRMQSAANTAVNSKKCLKMKLYYGTTAMSFDTYSGGECK